jgi:hypothetical protein
MSTGAFSGKDATFKSGGAALDVDVVGWNCDPSAADHRYGSDKTSGHKVAVAGTKDSNATVRIKLHSSQAMPFNVGDTLTAQFHVDDTGNNYIQQDVVVLSDPIPCDIDDGEPSEVEFALGPRGAPVYFGTLWAGAGSSGT